MRAWWPWLFLAVFTTAVTVNLVSPSDGFLSSSSNVVFSYSADANATSCALYANASGWAPLANASGSSVFSHNFTTDGFFTWAVSCSDGNQTSFSGNRTIMIDTTPPSTPFNVTASGNSPLNLTWSASSDFTSVSYRVFRNGTNVANVSSLSYSDNVPTATTYAYSIQAVDAAGLVSAMSSQVLVQGPSVALTMSGFSVSPSASGASFSWTTNVPSNATVMYANASTVLGVVSNPVVSSAASLALAGLQPATLYSYNATACAVGCSNVSGTFRTLASSFPSPSSVQANSSVASSSALFSAVWSDALPLTNFIFSTNVSGSWVNVSGVFVGNVSNASLVLPSSSVTFSWLFYAFNSQGALNQTPVQYLTVVVPAPAVSAVPTPVPTVVPVFTPVPSVVASSVSPTPTPVPTVVVTQTPAALSPSLRIESGNMSDLVVNAPGADFALSPTGLVVGVSTPDAVVVFSSNYTSFSDNETVLLRVRLVLPDAANGSGMANGSFLDGNGTPVSNSTLDADGLVVESLPVTLMKNQAVLLQTVPKAVLPGAYAVESQVVLADSGQVLDQKSLQVHVASSATGLVSESSSPVLLGVWVVLLSIAALFALQLGSLKKEFG